MKHFYLFFFFLISFAGFGQCSFNNSFFFSSQAQIDDFPIAYPDCTDVDVINVTGDDITNLQGLNQITTMRILNFSQNPLLETLDGMNPNLLIIEEGYIQITTNPMLYDISAIASQNPWINLNLVIIGENPSLTNLNGLQVLQGHHDSVNIDDNDSLTDLSGLQNITSADGINIGGNENLLTLNGLYAFLQTSDLNLYNNPNLTDISAINNAMIQITPTSSLRIVNNGNLALCNVPSICSAIYNWFPTASYYNINIYGNAPECGSVSQVAYNCNLIPINDDCVTSYPIILGVTTDGYTSYGSPSIQTPSCNDTNRIDVWFKFNSWNLSLVNINIPPDYSFQLWEGNCAAMSQVANSCAGDALSDVEVVQNTDYYLQVWSDGMATGLFNVLVEDATLSVEDEVFEGVSVYPNPVTNVLNVMSGQKVTSLDVYNLLGQVIASLKPNAFSTVVDFSSFQSGMYVLKVTSGNRTESFKLLKE